MLVQALAFFHFCTIGREALRGWQETLAQNAPTMRFTLLLLNRENPWPVLFPKLIIIMGTPAGAVYKKGGLENQILRET